MASSDGFLSEDQFTCSICLEIFSEPVSLPCGHNFCKACISKHWEEKVICQCPLCKSKFTKDLKLCINTGFREVVENFKAFQSTARKGVSAKPGEVPCDSCFGQKFKAAKTCLVCLASYCEDHLQPHYQNAALKTHKLTNPVLNLSDNICRNHNRMLEFFCRKDMRRACALCKDHVGHQMVPLKEEFKEKRSQLKQKKTEVQEMIQERQLKVQEISDALGKKRHENQVSKANSVQILSSPMVSVQRNLATVVGLIDKKQKKEEIQAQVLIRELNKEVTELQRKLGKLESISSEKDQLQLIKRVHCLSSKSPQTKNWSDVTLSAQLNMEDAKKTLVQMEKNLTADMKQMIQDFKEYFGQIIPEETPVEKSMVHLDLDSLPNGTKLDIIRQFYAVDVKLDPSTANDHLLFSRDLKEVLAPQVCWVNGKEPQKFNRYAFVLGKNPFNKGRFYYEVQVTMKTSWDLGVVRESFRGSKAITPNSKSGVWIIRLRSNTKLTALNHGAVPMREKPETVGVFVDFEQRQVSFYNVDTSTVIYTFTDCVFGGRIYPFFSPGLPEDGVNGSPLVLSTVGQSVTEESVTEEWLDAEQLVAEQSVAETPVPQQSVPKQTNEQNQMMTLILLVALCFYVFLLTINK